jgi:hypothetical protein
MQAGFSRLICSPCSLRPRQNRRGRLGFHERDSMRDVADRICCPTRHNRLSFLTRKLSLGPCQIGSHEPVLRVCLQTW